MNCESCGAPVENGKCTYCGRQYSSNDETVNQPINNTVNTTQQSADTVDSNWPLKSKGVAAFLAIFLGGLGIHKFYLGKVGMGILYICFCWTFVPSFIAFFEGIIYLCTNDHDFEIKHHVRLK